MTPATATATGRTLSRLGRLNRAPDGGPATSSRESIHHVIAQAGEAVPIEQICAATGLHANTVRPHLDVLLALDRISREQGQRKGRGRPPWLYRAVESPQERDRRLLAASLLKQLESADAPGLAAAAAQRWADSPGSRAQPAQTVDEAVSNAADSLSEIGFEVKVAPAGDRMDLLRCPYADLVADRPVICDIHAALLQQTLDASGQPVGLQSLVVFPRPGVCTAHLRRTDAHPIRTITMRSSE